MTLPLKIQTRSDFVDQSDGEVSLATTLDVPAWSTFLSEPATRDDVARMGLALYDAEARLLGDGLNLTAAFAEDAELGRQDGAELRLASADNDDRYWWHDRHSSLGRRSGWRQQSDRLDV
ncbi:MAG: hypothetical protein ACE360_06470 [Hyphomicrobiales bacterium]